MPKLPALAAAAVALFALAGCGPGKLNENKTLTLDDKAVAQSIILPAVSKPQTVNVEFSSSEGEVTVLLFKAEDIKDDDDTAVAPSGKALAKKRSKADSFSVEVPANTATRVVVREGGVKKTDVQVKVTNQK